MKKRIAAITAILCVLFVAATLTACIGDDYYTPGLKFRGVAVSDYKGESSEVVIPQVHNRRTVTCIGRNAFLNCRAVDSVTLPNSITEIRKGAFMGCGSLTSINIPNSVTQIGEHAFSECRSLMSINIPSSVTNIDADAFSCCYNLTIYCEAAERPSEWSAAWNDGCPVVWDCNNNEVADDGYVHFAEGGMSFGLKDGAATVEGLHAYRDGDIVIPESVTYKDAEYAVTCIGRSAFAGSSAAGITIPRSVTNIEEYAFSGCKNLTSIVIPSSVASIGTRAFSGCRNLMRATVSCSVAAIEENAFIECYALTIRCEAAERPNGWADGWNSQRPVVWDCNNSEVADDGCVYTVIDGIHYGLKDGEATVAGQSTSIDGEVNLPQTVAYKNNNYAVTVIGEYAFYNCDGMKGINMPSGIVRIENTAFAKCDKLLEVIVPDGVMSIGDMAFYSCNILSVITLPRSLSTIGSSMIGGCHRLERIIYNGTKAAWIAIDKDELWYGFVYAEVKCTNGVIKIKD